DSLPPRRSSDLLHAIASEAGFIRVWCVRPLNEHEAPVAMQLLDHMPAMHGQSLIMADGNYDGWELHKKIAKLGSGLLSPPRGYATHPVSLRQMGPARREALSVWQRHRDLAANVYKQRIGIERVFSALCSYGGGLGPLPAWVRTLGRVRRWVGVKILLYHARLIVRKTAAA